MAILNRIAEFQDELTEWRRDIHMHPETAYEEFRTAKIVSDKLTAWGLEVETGIAVTGVVGVLKGTQPDNGRVLALRADMDALPMTEENDFAHKSKHEGKMHGCGHDGHTVMLLGAAKYLSENRDFAGTVHFIFQPAEEGGAGADKMIKEGLFDRYPADAVFGMHNWPGLEPGEAAVISGPVMAAADEFELTINGIGGHAAFPHTTVDPIFVGAQIITALQGIVGRNVDPLDQAVVTVSEFHAGNAFNVIPAEAKLTGTVRTFKEETRQFIAKRMDDIVTSIARANGATVDFNYHWGYPATVNDAKASDFAAKVLEEVVGVNKVHRDVPACMGGEDFAYMLQQKPGSYIWMGQEGTGADGVSPCMLHNPRYDFNDDILPLGVSYWVRLTHAYLADEDLSL